MSIVRTSKSETLENAREREKWRIKCDKDEEATVRLRRWIEVLKQTARTLPLLTAGNLDLDLMAGRRRKVRGRPALRHMATS